MMRAASVRVDDESKEILCTRKRRRNSGRNISLSSPSRDMVAADLATLTQLREWLPTVTHGGVTGVRAVDIACIFGKKWPRNAVDRASVTTKDIQVVGSGNSEVCLVLNPVGAADLLLHMPWNEELKKIRGYCAKVHGRRLKASIRRRGYQGVAPFLLEIACAAGLYFSVPLREC